MQGYCRNDTSCPFAHGNVDLHGMLITSQNPSQPAQVPQPVPVAQPPPPQQVPQAQQNQQPQPDYGQAGQFLLSILRNL